MNPRAPDAWTGRRRKRAWRWIFLATVLGALSAPWWFPNLPWVKHRLARHLSERTGLECRLGPINVLGGDGRSHLHGLQLSRPDQAEPIVDLPHLAATLRWSALARGRLEITHLVINGGRVNWSPPPLTSLPMAPEATTQALPAAATDTLAAAEVRPERRDDKEDEIPAGDTGLLGSSALTTTDAHTGIAPSPTDPSPVTAPDAAAPKPPPVATGEAPPSPDPSPQPPDRPAPPPTAPPTRRWSLGRLQLSDFHVRWVRSGDPQADEVASATLEVDIPLGNPTSAADRVGLVRGENMRLAGRVWPSSVSLPVTWDGATLRTHQAAVPVPGGAVSLSWDLLPAAPGLPLTGEASFAGIRLEDVSRWLAPDSEPAAGLAEGHVRFAVPVRRPGRLRTVGQGRLTNLVLPMRAWLEAAAMPGLATRWPAAHWPTRGAHLQFSSGAGVLTIEDASLFAEELTVRALGTATAAGGPSLAVRGYVPPGGADLLSRLSATWPPDRQLHPQPLPDSPWAFLDVGIQGSWGQPEFVLWDRAWLLPDLRSEIRRLQGPPPPS